MRYKASKASHQNNDVEFFVKVFQNRLHRTPNEYIDEKLATGSKLDAVKYLFDIQAAAISLQNNCKYFDFDYFYNRNSNHIKTKQSNSHKSTARPQNAGKLWTAEEEPLLIKLYNSGATKAKMCERFGRTENGLAARLVRLGVIRDRDTFYKIR